MLCIDIGFKMDGQGKVPVAAYHLSCWYSVSREFGGFPLVCTQ